MSVSFASFNPMHANLTPFLTQAHHTPSLTLLLHSIPPQYTPSLTLLLRSSIMHSIPSSIPPPLTPSLPFQVICATTRVDMLDPPVVPVPRRSTCRGPL